MAKSDNLRIDPARLWDSHMDMAKIGPGVAGGNNRQTLTDEDREGRDLFRQWCEAAGMTVTVDKIGNMFARRPGRNNDLPPVMMGSHLDTQPTGGRFDGVFGVLAGLEVVRSLNDLGMETEAPLEVVNWTNEEGGRFPPPMVGSAVFAGQMPLEKALDIQDLEGARFGDELKRIGFEGDQPLGRRPIGAYFECHIEQGPILEAEEKSVGVVTGVQAMRWYEVTVTGRESHAGTTPPGNRRCALTAASRIVLALDEIMQRRGVDGRCTVGVLEVKPGSPNVIPGEVFFTVDIRNPTVSELDVMDQEFRDAVAAVTADGTMQVEVTETWLSPPVLFDPGCVAAVRHGAETAGHAWRDIMSGAGHDAVHVSKIAPTAMIFVPCKDGISHNEAEYSAPEHLAAGCDVLLRAVLEYANREAAD